MLCDLQICAFSRGDRKKTACMIKKLEIYFLILKSLFADFVKKALKAMVVKKETPNRSSEFKQEATRLLLIGRYRASKIEKHTRYRLSAVGTTVLAVVLVFSVIASSQVFSVSVNGQIIGYVSEKDDYAQLVNNVKEKISRENGNSEIIIKEADIELKPTIKLDSTEVFSAQTPEAIIAPEETNPTVPAPEVTPAIQPLSGAQDESSPAVEETTAGETISDAGVPLTDSPADEGSTETPKTDALETALIDTLIKGDAVKATVYNIEINGTPMATLASFKEASDVLQNVANAYKIDIEEAKNVFVDDVQIIGKTVELNAVRAESVEEVTAYLLSGINNAKSYTTIEDDTSVEIANGLGITEEELIASYPDTDFLLVKEGEVFEYVINTPYLRYETSIVEEVDLPIQFETVEKRTNRLYFGETEDEIPGELGIRHVNRTVTRINGVIVAVEEHSSEVIKEPSPATVLTGTLLRPEDLGFKSETGEGVLGRPLDSWSLSRSVGGAHQGADMLAPQGTPIYASEAGTVVHADWFSAYGLLVRVNHGNGLETYYAHCDTINVAVGQTVERGQQIATVGITGRATAFHLHFEVRVNGSVQEPLDWIG